MREVRSECNCGAFLFLLLFIPLIAIDFGASYGFYEWYINIYQGVDDNKAKLIEYGYDLEIVKLHTRNNYVCMPFFYVDYRFNGKQYHHVKTKPYDLFALNYNNWTDDNLNECLSKFSLSFPMGINIERCHVTENHKNPGCICREECGKHLCCYDDKNCCNYGYNEESFYVAIILIGVTMLVITIVCSIGIFVLVCTNFYTERLVQIEPAVDPEEIIVAPIDVPVVVISPIDPMVEEPLRQEVHISCRICLGPPKGQAVVLSCGHTYCKSCIEKWQENHPSECPTCKKIVSTISIFGE